MDTFKKYHFLFCIAIAIVACALFMSHRGFQRQITGVPDAQAQDSIPLLSYVPGYYAAVYPTYSLQDTAIRYPSDLFETIKTSWGSRVTVMSCSGGFLCNWGLTSSTCSSAMSCLGASIMTCASGNFCDVGGSTLMTCSMGLLCGRITLSTCSSGFFCDGVLTTHFTCSAFTGCGSTLITCIPYGCFSSSGGTTHPTSADCSYTMNTSLGVCLSTYETCPPMCQYRLRNTSSVTIPPAF